MPYLILRLLYLIYFFVGIMILVVTISRMLFSKVEIRMVLQSLAMALIWPIALFSAGGRKVLRQSLSFRR